MQALTIPDGTLMQIDSFLEHSPSRRNLYYKGLTLQKVRG